ncbi:hypothetical protein ACLMJK_008986 [Lecanora helva]
MKSSYLYSWLFSIIAATLTAAQNDSCIADNEVEGIAQRWLDAFATGGLKGLPDAVTSDIHIYDEGVQNGSTIPYIQNYTQLQESISASAYGGGGVTNVTYDVLFTFHTCHRIALRWQETAITTNDIGYGSTVLAGKKIQFKGTDLLTIDLASKKVMNATTSADLLNYYRGLGYPLGALAS